MYRIVCDKSRLLVTATLEGYWTLATLAGYQTELELSMRQVAGADDFVRLLARSAAMPVQSAQVSEAFGRFTAELGMVGQGPIAITVGSMLNKIQATRALAHKRIQVFLDEAEALEWLFSWGPKPTPSVVSQTR